MQGRCRGDGRDHVAIVDLPTRHPYRAAVEGDGLGEAGQPALGRRVRTRAGPGHLGRDGAVIDDAAALRLLARHEAVGLPRRVEGREI